MKIYPNNEMNIMLKNGTASVIDYKLLPSRYLKKETLQDIKPIGKEEKPGNERSAAAPAPEAESFEKLPQDGVPDISSVLGQIILPGFPPDTAAPAVYATAVPIAAPTAVQPFTPPPVAEQTVQPEATTPTAATVVQPFTPPPVAEQTVQPEATTPTAAPTVQPITPPPAAEQIVQPEAVPVSVMLPEEMPPAPVPVMQPEEMPPAPVPVMQPEEMPPAPVPVMRPEAIPPTAAAPVIVAPPPEKAPDIPAVPYNPDAKPGVTSTILQPETSPGGLIAEIHFEGDPAGLVFGTSPGYVSCESAIGPARPEERERSEEGAVSPPYINFITFNRLGLTIKNLSNLLDSDEDFELNIIDCNSKDNSWDYILGLNDKRIKSRIRFNKNCGPIFATNFALSRRKPGQYFIVMDSDTYIKTKPWIARFMEVFEAFPEVGLLGLMRDNPYPRYLPPIIPRVNGSFSYLELKNADIDVQMDFIPGQLQCLRPELIDEIGYWSEENGFGDAEISPRIVHYTTFKVGFLTTIEIDMTQRIACDECVGRDICKLSRSVSDCFMISKLYNKNESFVVKNTWKFTQSFKDLKEGSRTAYCASIHDPDSVKTHIYNADWAYDNFNHYILYAN